MKRIGVLSLVAILIGMAFYAGAPLNFAAPKPVISVIAEDEVQTIAVGEKAEYTVDIKKY